MATAKVILFKDSGKYYTEEEWEIPEDAIGPYDMEKSKNFRRIGSGAVLVETQEPWGYPHLIPSLPVAYTFEVLQDGLDNMWIAKGNGVSIRHADKAEVIRIMNMYLKDLHAKG